MTRYYVAMIHGIQETRLGDRNLSVKEAKTKRDRLNEALAHQGVKYSDCRYAVRQVNERVRAVAA